MIETVAHHVILNMSFKLDSSTKYKACGLATGQTPPYILVQPSAKEPRSNVHTCHITIHIIPSAICHSCRREHHTDHQEADRNNSDEELDSRNYCRDGHCGNCGVGAGAVEADRSEIVVKVVHIRKERYRTSWRVGVDLAESLPIPVEAEPSLPVGAEVPHHDNSPADPEEETQDSRAQRKD